MNPRALAFVPLLAALLVSPARAVAEPSGARVVVVPLSGAPVEGSLESVGDAGLSLAGRAAPIPLGEVRALKFPGASPAAGGAPRGPVETRLRVVLRGEEMLRGTFSKGSTDALELKPDDLAAVRIPFDAIRRIEAESAHKKPCSEPARERPPRPGTDVAYAVSGDAIAGTWVEASATGVVLESERRKTTVPWADLVVLHVDEPALPPATGLTAEVDTVGGSRLIAATISGDSQSWKVGTRAGLVVDVPVGAIVEARFTGGAFVYASDLPFRSSLVPYYGDDLDSRFLEHWYRARADRTPNGCPLRLNGVAYRHGIAVHAKSSVTLPLAKGFTRFEAKFGIDDEALDAPDGIRGDVTARVLADGKEVWTSAGHVKGGEAPRAVGPLDVTGVAELVLEVDFGDAQYQMDRADWADPVLVRAK